MPVPLRILHVIPAIAPRYGGPSTMVVGLCRSLEDRGHRSEIVSSNADGDGELDLPIGVLSRYKDVWLRCFPRKYGEAFKYAPGMAKWLADHVADFDVVHIHAVFSWSSLVASRACRNANVPYLVRPLGSLDPWSLARRPLLKKLLGRLGVQTMLREASYLHYTTRLEQQAAESAGRYATGVVIPNAVELPECANTEKDVPLITGRYLLFIGRLSEKKKLETLIEGFAGSNQTGRYRLVIAGDGDPVYRKRIEEAVVASGCADRIVLFGWADAAARCNLIRHSELGVLVSANENYGIAVVEAMAFGKPVVVNRGVYLYPDIEHHKAGWVIDDTVNLTSGLAALLNTVLAEEDECRVRGANARRLVAQRYTWDRVADQLLALYETTGGATRQRRDEIRRANQVSVMIFTLNESRNLPHCLAALDWCDDVIVIDSGSSDETVNIARRSGARVYSNPFEGFGSQRNWAIDHAEPAYSWVLMLDADERVRVELAVALNAVANAHPDGRPVAAARLARRFYLWGKWLRYSSLYPVWVVRLVHKARVRYVNRGHAETQNVDGEIVRLDHDLVDENHKDMAAWEERQQRYAEADARYEASQQNKPVAMRGLVSSDPLQRKASLKQVASRLPLRSGLYFLYGLILKRGFLDGTGGLRLTAMRARYQQQVAAAKKAIRTDAAE